MSALILVMGDQLSFDIPALKAGNKQNDIVLLAELREEASYVRHHKKKIAFLFSAMRHFAEALRAEGWQVDYIKLTDKDNTHSFASEAERALHRHQLDKILVTHPSEYRVLQNITQWREQADFPVEILEDDRFYCSIDAFASWAEGRKQLRMEFFYRELRRQTGILMQEGAPIGGQWNYDSDNRKPPDKNVPVPAPTRFVPDAITEEVCQLVETEFADHYGDLYPFSFATTHAQAEEVLQQFIAQRLVNFGSYQDAMRTGEPFMFHSHIGFYLNCGLLSPMQAVEAAHSAYHKGDAPLHSVEGFIRQILGWREFVRGLYWLKMPEYREMNFLEADRPLPDFFWDCQTEMNCLHQCFSETRKYAYAHHIQRLMVIGNFSLLAGLSPAAVNDWYLSVYADAYEWVELPNVTGMVLFADGGILASKPYAAGSAYIERMSDYCADCRYSPKEKTGDRACPFGYLYWDFLGRHEEKLRGNPRLGMIYRSRDKMSDEKKQQISMQSKAFLDSITPS
ncbi:MAG: cryptochrome/photolyase family protein [Candidatus Puniceispirillaceae bacterium]